MKLNSTYILLDSARTSGCEDWEKAHEAISTAIRSMRWPDHKAAHQFRIPRIVSLKPGSQYIRGNGKQATVKKKKITLRNGVKPLRNQFQRWMADAGWNCEEPCSLKPLFEKLRQDKTAMFSKYPFPGNKVDGGLAESLNETVGDFDYWFRTDSGFVTVVEWETGNISSSHRSLNKMCLALMGNIVQAGVLVVPSKMLYPHLTDRIGNIRELQPYFYFWNRVGSLVSSGLLAVVEVEHDELFKSSDVRDFVPTGPDGNSVRSRRR